MERIVIPADAGIQAFLTTKHEPIPYFRPLDSGFTGMTASFGFVFGRKGVKLFSARIKSPDVVVGLFRNYVFVGSIVRNIRA